MNTTLYPPRASRALPASQRKWNPGDPIKDFDQFFRYVHERRYFFVEGRAAGYNPAFIASWPVRYLRMMIQTGRLLVGVRNPAAPWVFKADWHEATTVDGVRLRGSKSTYLVRCDDMPAGDFQGASRDRVMRTARVLAREFAKNPQARVEVVFNDWDRP